MESITYSSIIALLSILGPICLIALFAWVILKTNSRHPVFFRLWQLVHGRHEITDPTIREYIDEQNSLMSFRFIAGVQVDNLENARQLITWTRLHKIEMFELRMAGQYFDANLRTIDSEKLPTKFKLIFTSTLLGITFVIGTLLLCFAMTSKSVFKLKSTDRWFWMSETSAHTISYLDKSLKNPAA